MSIPAVSAHLSLPELEQVRLILSGGSVVDWFRLRFADADEVRAFLQRQGGDPNNSDDIARLASLRRSAAAYLMEEHPYRVPAELVECDPIELFLYASGARGRRRDRFLACMLLKVMHVVHHAEARELRHRLTLSPSRLAELLVEKVDEFAAHLTTIGFPLVRYSGGQKSATSVITKLLVKKEYHAAAIHDRVRFRFVVSQPIDVVMLLAEMTRSLFPFNYVVPAQSVNQLVNFTAWVESDPVYRTLAPELQLELGEEETTIRQLNEFSGPSFRVMNFIADVPICVPNDLLLKLPVDDEELGRIVFSLAEFQVVDELADQQNEHGENRHERYRARQLSIVRERLERAKRKDDGN